MIFFKSTNNLNLNYVCIIFIVLAWGSLLFELYFCSKKFEIQKKKTVIHKKVRISRFSVPGHILQKPVKNIMIAVGHLDY